MKIKKVSVDVTFTKGIAKVYSEQTQELYSDDFEIPTTFKTQEGLEKAVREYYNKQNLILVKLCEYAKVKVTYSAPIEEFMVIAKKEIALS